MVLDVLKELKKRKSERNLAMNNFFVYPSENEIGPSTDQAKFYDVGNFQLGAQGCQTGLIGEIWVEYSFTMIRRKTPESDLLTSGYAHFTNYGDDLTAAAPLGASATAVFTDQTGSTLTMLPYTARDPTAPAEWLKGQTCVWTSDTTFQLPNKNARYFLQMYWSGATAIAAVATVTPTGGASGLNVFGPTGSTVMVNSFLAAGTSASATRVIETTQYDSYAATYNLVSITGLTSMASGNLDIFLFRMPLNSTLSHSAPKAIGSRLEQLERQIAQLSGLTVKDFSDYEDLTPLKSSSSSQPKLSQSVVDLIASKLRN